MSFQWLGFRKLGFGGIWHKHYKHCIGSPIGIVRVSLGSMNADCVGSMKGCIRSKSGT